MGALDILNRTNGLDPVFSRTMNSDDCLVVHEFPKLAEQLREAGVTNLELCKLLFADGEERAGISWDEAACRHCPKQIEQLAAAKLSSRSQFQVCQLVEKIAANTRRVGINKMAWHEN